MRPHIRDTRLAQLALLLTMAGCAADTAADTAPTEADAPLALVTQNKAEAPVTLRPQGVYFAEVTASGSGCPAGSWRSSISADGQVFTTLFSSYEVSVNETVPNSTRDCAIEMKLTSDAPRSFAVLSVFYSGYVFLEDGVTGRQTVRYGFHGESADAGNSRTEFAGPDERDFVIEDNVGADKQKWSACGPAHTLTASTELRLQSKGTKASGYINVFAVDGTAARLELRLGWRGCEQGGRATNGNTGGANNGGANNGGANNGKAKS